MADQKITQLTELSATPASTDVVPIVDIDDTTMAGSGTTKKISVTNLLASKADSTHDHAIGDITGTVPTSQGGTNLTAIGTALQTLRVNAGATALEFADPAGDITGVTAGTNLNGGGASGDVTVNLDTTITGITQLQVGTLVENVADAGVTIDSVVLKDGNATATTFTGNLTGNVTGNADTVTTNANLTGDVTSVGNATTLGTVPVAKGGTGSTTAGAARTALDVDVAGTDNSTNVTLTGTPDYITISGQEITRGLVALAGDVTGNLDVTNLNSGTNAGETTFWCGDGTWVVPSTSSTPEGIAVLSTGETGGAAFLRENGDGTCSWVVPSGSGNVSTDGATAENQVGVWTGDGTIEGTSSLVFDSTGLGVGGVTPSELIHAQSTAADGAILIKVDGSNGTQVASLRAWQDWDGTGGGTAVLQLGVKADAGSTVPDNAWYMGTTGTDDNKLQIGYGTGGWKKPGDGDFLTITSGGDCQWYNTSAAVKMTWDASAASLGIGVTVPVTTLNIKGDESANGQLYIEPTGDGEYAGLVVKTTRGADREWGVFAGGTGADDLNFRIRDETANADRLNIDSAGLVGIGTDSPAVQLHQNVTAGNIVEHRLQASTVYTKIIADDASGFSAIDASHDLRFKEAGSEVMRITGGDCQWNNTSGAVKMTWDASAASLGIGTDSPDTLLELETDAASTCILQLKSTAADSYPSIRFKNDAAEWRLYGADGSQADEFVIHGGTNGSLLPRLSITTGGDCQWHNASGAVKMTWDASAESLGIGTAVPDDVLHVATGGIRVDGTPDESSGTNSLGMGVISSVPTIFTLNSADLAFKTGGTERLRITSAGLVGIGTDSPSNRLTLKPAAQFEQTLKFQVGVGGTVSGGYIGDGGESENLWITAGGEVTATTGSADGFTARSNEGAGSGKAAAIRVGDGAGTIGFYTATGLTDGSTFTLDGGSETGLAMSITSAGRVTVKKSSNSEITELTSSSASTAVDMDAANNFSLALGENTTLAQPTNITAGQSGAIVITQDVTGSRTMAYHAYWHFEGGTAPTLSTAVGSVDTLVYYVASATSIHAVLLKDIKTT